jgi:hypothetical protein
MYIPFKMFLVCPNAPLPSGLVVVAALRSANLSVLAKSICCRSFGVVCTVD